MFGRLKAVANYEFATVLTHGHPEYKVEVTWDNQEEPKLFGKINRYGEDIVFGQEALDYLGWSKQEANRHVRAFHM